jgi:hypothetical protein
MHDKPPEVRHVEHEGFVKRLESFDAAMDKQEENGEDFRLRLVEQFTEFRLELLKEVHAIERSIQMKCENDNLLIATQNREVGRLDRVESAGAETAKALAVVAASMQTLKANTDTSLTAAHTALRGHGTRLERLETHGGKLAIKILYSAVGVAATVAITSWVTMLLAQVAQGR